MSILIDTVLDGFKSICYNCPLEVLWTTCIFASSVPYLHRSLTTKGWEMSRKAPTYTLIPHIIISLLEVVVFNLKQWQSEHDPLPTPLDLFLCILQVSTALYLAEKQGNVAKAVAPPLARAAFHTMVCQRLLASGLAAYLGSAKWHRASIKVLHSFIWSRGFITVGKYMSVFDTRVKAVAGGTVLSGLGGIYEGSYPHGNLIWIGCMMGLLALDKLGQQYDKALTVLGFMTRRNGAKDK